MPSETPNLPTYSVEDLRTSNRSPNDGASFDEASSILAVLQITGKTRSGMSSVLLLAMAMLLDDTHEDPAAADAKADALPALLRACLATVREMRLKHLPAEGQA